MAVGINRFDQVVIDTQRQVLGIQGTMQAARVSTRLGVEPVPLDRSRECCGQGVLHIQVALMQGCERVLAIPAIL